MGLKPYVRQQQLCVSRREPCMQRLTFVIVIDILTAAAERTSGLCPEFGWERA